MGLEKFNEAHILLNAWAEKSGVKCYIRDDAPNYVEFHFVLPATWFRGRRVLAQVVDKCEDKLLTVRGYGMPKSVNAIVDSLKMLYPDYEVEFEWILDEPRPVQFYDRFYYSV
jgi:hypothetical protein